MSGLGQNQTSSARARMSAISPKADIAERDCHVRFVPKADIVRCGKIAVIRSLRRRGREAPVRSQYQAPWPSALSLEKRVRPKLLTDLPPNLAKLIEEVRVDNHGRLIPKLYSKERANKELRNMLNLNAKSDAADVTKLSDQELLQTL